MRCLALTQAWQEAGGVVAFACADLPEALEVRLRSEQCAVHRFESAPTSQREAHDVQETLRIANRTHPQWLVLDGYQFGPDYQLALRDVQWRLMVIDDDGRHEAYHADVLLNQNAGAAAVLYGRHTHASRILLGCQYAMLRREFRQAPRRSATSQSVSQILLTLGGADRGNVTERFLTVLRSCAPADCQIQVLIGPANPHVFRLQEVAAKMNHVTLHVAPSNLPEIMVTCDLAITAAGSSVYELGYLGVPMLLVVTADNQRPIATALDHLRAARRIDELGTNRSADLPSAIESLMSDATARAEYAARFQQLVDGRGATRVVTALREVSGFA